MNKLILLFAILTVFCTKASCITKSEMIVQRFGSNMAKWCSTKNFEYFIAALKDCHNQDGTPMKVCIVKDSLMLLEGTKSGLSRKHYVIQNYLNVFQDFLRSGNISYQMYNVKERPYDEIAIANYSSIAENIAKTCTYVSCDVQISGSMNYKLKNLFVISAEGKIWQISPYEETIGEKNEKKKDYTCFSVFLDGNEKANK